MFGISLLEIALILSVTLVVVGPQKLPGMLRTMGQWARKLRRITNEVRMQSGIDDLLRQEGLHGGVNELRGLIRGELSAARPPVYASRKDEPHNEAVQIDLTREYPPEGVDAAGAIPDDLWDDGSEPNEPSAPEEASATQAVGSPPMAEQTTNGEARSDSKGLSGDAGKTL